jgi:hypothetical protein
MTDSGTADDPQAQHAAMQAVVVIHGMGEQRPMDTIKAFVRAVWETDERITRNGLPHQSQVWSKPDLRTGSLELRRITTRESIPSRQFPRGVRTDFYELYWADLTAGSTWDQFTGWVRGLLLRPWSRVPRDVRLAWLVLWIASIVVLAILGLSGLSAEVGLTALAEWHGLLAPLPLGSDCGSTSWRQVVRYTRADPANIAARRDVRQRGLKLLNALHGGPYYKRIVIVSHSLGTILAHDLLSYFWAQREAARKIDAASPEFDALCALETAAAELDRRKAPATRDNYRAAQRCLRFALARRKPPPGAVSPYAPASDPRWLISDFVTLGSPLTHAEFLLAASRGDLERRKFERELPQCPPMREELDPKVLALACATQKLPVDSTCGTNKLISFPPPSAKDVSELHHAAPFAVVRWTNLCDPASLVYRGDIIGGPMANVFGPAIVDTDLRKLRGPSDRFTHTKYWEIDGEPKHIEVLRKAVNLLDEDEYAQSACATLSATRSC